MNRILFLLNQGVSPDLFHFASVLNGGGKGAQQQAAPDYTGAAEKQGAAAKEIATATNWANRPTINTPWGSQTWEASKGVDPATGQDVTDWTQNINLNPNEAAALKDQQEITAGRSSTAKSLLGQVADATSTPFNWDGMPKVPGSIEDAQKSAYEKMAAELQPGRQQADASVENKLVAMGLPRNSEAWNRAKNQLQSQWTQEDKGMLSQSMAEGRADVNAQQGLRTAAIAEEAQKRGMSLNELNALLTGQQVSMPQGMSQAPNSTAAGSAAPNYLGAAQSGGQFALGQQQNMLQGGTNWGSAIGGIASVASKFV